MIIAVQSIPNYLSISPTSIVNLNRMFPDYLLQSDTPQSIMEDTAVFMDIEQLVAYDRYRRVIIFSNNKLQYLCMRQQQSGFLNLTAVVCDSDPFNVITKLLTLNRYIKDEERTLTCFVVADHPQKEEFVAVLDLQWCHIQNEKQISEYLPALERFLLLN